EEELRQAAFNNPDETSARGLWSEPSFLENVTELNPALRHTQFADFHGHGWVFRAVWKKDRAGQLLDHRGEVIRQVTNARLQAAIKIQERIQQALKDPAKPMDSTCRNNIPVHLMDIHLEKGMHCVDCHFVQDAHGNGKLYGEVRAAIEIQCTDCHGTINQHA